MKCRDVIDRVAHPTHWHTVMAGPIVVAQGQCLGYEPPPDVQAEAIAMQILGDTDLLTPNHDGTPEHYVVAADDLPALVRLILEVAHG